MPDLPSLRRQIKAAQTQMAMEQEDYQALLVRLTGKASSTRLTAFEAGRVLDEFRRLGWRPRRRNARQIARIQYLWLRLGEAGLLEDQSKQALYSFCVKFTGTRLLHKAASNQLRTVIDCLQAWCKREKVEYKDHESGKS
ncbi:phage protein GemA/Gp16 family protein [Bowmanella dokdonensis]|uniref:DUF1018 domain-containing protein n=1 Tax=Bowmanella dokdonensis TaxID=751969 RepID=A0A939ILZ6_9ALTE|nr:phage protein GemA/Gp16 family protein [Bowmanella dokdonensis]MBN7824743.1 DUF1018 domain-containing protein [Bowmanella dokdonensis]